MRNYLFLCFMKKDAGPAIIESIAESLKDKDGEYAYFLVPKQIENRKELEKICGNVRFIYIDTGNKKNFILKSIKFAINGRRVIANELSGIKLDLFLQIFVHPWGNLIRKWIECNYDTVICHDPIPHSGEKIINTMISEYCYKHAKNLIVLTKSFMKIAESRFKKKVFYMPHGLYSNYRLDEAVVEESLEKCSELTFLFFGRIEEYKGIEILLRAFLKFDGNDNVNLIVAGNGNIEPYKFLLRNNRIRMINRYLNDSEISELFSNRNAVLVLPYIDATQSGIALIAMGLGVPIIATDTGGLREQLNDGRFGLFCKPGDVEDLYEKMFFIYQNREIMEEERNKMRTYNKTLGWHYLLNKLICDISDYYE